jgi:hypothetical protein
LNLQFTKSAKENLRKINKGRDQSHATGKPEKLSLSAFSSVCVTGREKQHITDYLTEINSKDAKAESHTGNDTPGISFADFKCPKDRFGSECTYNQLTCRKDIHTLR